MTVYNGNSKIANIYNGNQKIKEVYYGSTKVYSSGIPIWRFNTGNNDSYIYLIGEYSPNGIIAWSSENIDPYYGPELKDITAISGTLGSSGSSVSFQYDYGSTNVNLTALRKTGTFGGKTLYQYDGSGYVGIASFGVVKQGSVVGDKLLDGLIGLGVEYTITLSGNDISVSYSGSTMSGTLDTSYLKYWTDDGIE